MQTGLYCLKRSAVLYFVWINTLCCLWNFTSCCWQAGERSVIQQLENKFGAGCMGLGQICFRSWWFFVVFRNEPSLHSEILLLKNLSCDVLFQGEWNETLSFKHWLKIKWPWHKLDFINFDNVLQPARCHQTLTYYSWYTHSAVRWLTILLLLHIAALFLKPDRN